jgi:Ca2+-binding RTX toxin-like protein
VGGTGDDTYVVSGDGDLIVEAKSAGNDLVESSVTTTLGTNLERLTLTGGSAINGTGNTQANVLTGNASANILDGGKGNDTMAGGLGNDTYVVNAAGDVVTEAASAGTDLIQSSVTRILEAEVENLTLTGTGNLKGTGNGLNNTIIGNAGANVLDGVGDLLDIDQKDSLTGGVGADVFVLGSAAGRYYDDGDVLIPGTADYVHVTDFNSGQGDKLRLKGSAADYFLGSNPIAGLTGQGLFFDSDRNRILGNGDELIAVLNNTAVSLTQDVNYIL